MTIIAAIQSYIKQYSSLKSGAPVWVNFIGPNPTEYSIVPLPGARIVESYISGNSLREYAFAFQSVESTADDLERLDSQGFFEAFAEWLEDQTDLGVLPTLSEDKVAEKIEVTGQGYLFREGESQTGIYQIQCKLTYTQNEREQSSSS